MRFVSGLKKNEQSAWFFHTQTFLFYSISIRDFQVFKILILFYHFFNVALVEIIYS